MVLVKDPKVVESYNNKKFGKPVDTSVRFEGFNEAYKVGIEDGESFSISDKIAREGEEVLELQV